MMSRRSNFAGGAFQRDYECDIEERQKLSDETKRGDARRKDEDNGVDRNPVVQICTMVYLASWSLKPSIPG